MSVEIHVSPGSRVPDHYWAYALSYQSDLDFVSTCDHEHDLRCDRCELFSNVVSEIESALESVDTSNGEKDEMKYVVSLAKKKWKHGKLIYSDQSTKMKRGCVKVTRH